MKRVHSPSAMAVNIEERLYQKAREFLSSSRGLRQNKTEDIFDRKLYIVSDRDILVENYQRERPKMAFNPGAMLQGKELVVFPRLIFDYYTYTSSIGRFKVNVEHVLNRDVELPVSCSVVLWPSKLWEFRGCEDARVFKEGEDTIMLYTGYGYSLERGNLNTTIVQALTRFDREFHQGPRDYFRVKSAESGCFVPKASKDSAFISVQGNEAMMLTRPLFKDIEVGWRTRADMKDMTMDEKTLEPSLPFEDWEMKVGWSTNVVRVSSNEHLVGWHGILKEDYSYRDGLALVDDQGELLEISDYVLAPRGLNEEYGDRPLVIFGNGLVVYKEYLIWVGGVCDYAIGFFVTELDKALAKLRRVKSS
jgi:predicted GH43/DUF377 family glycosyl hydrolase